jgi:hypothetical protein
MRFPVKFNRAYWHKALTKIVPSATDPRVLCDGTVNETKFTNAVSTFKFGSTFKTTQKARFPLVILELAQLKFQTRPVILDVGASDGSTSLDVMQAVPYEKYHVTDLNTEVFYEVTDAATWFYDEKGTCILMVTDKWVVYPETRGAIFPFNKISEAIFSRAPQFEGDAAKVILINPALQMRKESRIVVETYNIFEAWRFEKADLIIAANILNRVYFTDCQIRRALNNLVAALNNNGRIVIVDNRPGEKSTIFQFVDGVARVEKRVNGGTEIEALALNSFEARCQKPPKA